jgi:hypothetical protein
MRVLIACEESQRVATEFRRLGHEAYSCDIEPCGGGYPMMHLNVDALQMLKLHWDLVIAHPPCTYLTVTGNRWFNEERYGDKARERKREREDAERFFMAFAECGAPHVCIENPVGVMSTAWRKPDQIVQPYEFGDPYEKKTCLWLEGLKPLKPTNVVKPEPRRVYKSGNTMPAWYADAWSLPPHERAKVRSRTFPGIAKAMAAQFCEQIGMEGLERDGEHDAD